MKMKIIIIFNVILPLLSFSQNGSLDISFGNNGISSVCEPYSNTTVRSILQSDGKILTTGFIYDNSTGVNVSRFNNDGSIDTSFGNNGFTNNEFETILLQNVAYNTNGIGIQNDGKIVILLSTYGDTCCTIVRLNTNGSIDTSFNNGVGFHAFSFGTLFTERSYCLSIQSDNKILVGGKSCPAAVCFAIVRLNPNGDFDTSFGTNGKVLLDFNEFESAVKSIIPLPDGKILLGGYTTSATRKFTLLKLNNNGSLDNSFGVNGYVIQTTYIGNITDILENIAVKSDGKIVVVGKVNAYFVENYPYGGRILQYYPDGTLDTNFGTNGSAFFPDFAFVDVKPQLDGKLVVGTEGFQSGVYKLNSNGSFDTTFGNNGKSVLIDIDYIGYIYNLLQQADNKIIATGTIQIYDDQGNGTLCTTLARLNNEVLSNESFNSSSLKLSPNPTYGPVYFDNSSAHFETFEVYNYQGQQLFRGKINFDSNQEIDFFDCARGVYLVKLSNSSYSTLIKVIKQ